MRSNLVFSAMALISDRFMLTKLVSKQPENSTDLIAVFKRP